jgi:hypothetical protein
MVQWLQVMLNVFGGGYVTIVFNYFLNNYFPNDN